MKKRYVIIISVFFAASLIFLIGAIGYNNAQSKKLDESKTSNQALNSRLETGKQEKLQNGVLIDKINNDPNRLAKDAKSNAEKLVDVIKEQQGKADKDKMNAYKSELKGFVSENVRNSEILTSISIDKDYDVDVSTQRGESIPVLISSKDKYIVIEYNAYADEISGVKEYKQA
ncbi:hypothetical protein MHZ36_12705 [Staphylococcus sp. ACRSN]|uniref:hypothetical protein n=1 Tax=Staphylococcus TaxID=1279 RepID=UPI0011C9D239|nr:MULTISPECIES: hypothetical protein [Staphylococcus]MCG7340149.1 hypothetical protein [Staphylococcus sp. ACRSN]MEB6279094.1 hypothetical protein [Staphylococcus gallinarum]